MILRWRKWAAPRQTQTSLVCSRLAPLLRKLKPRNYGVKFYSVEISSKPNAEANSIDYAEAPLTFNSVETIPALNASAVFEAFARELLMSDYDMGDGGHVFRTC